MDQSQGRTDQNSGINANITSQRNQVLKELKEVLYRCEEKRKSYNIRRRVNRLKLKKIGKRQNLTEKDL